ncbi:MAG: mercuric ion transport protein [Sphingobacteriales bacterium]|jgi:mercuric ion transport protein
MKNDNKLMGAGILTAITASLCCITPLLALIAGASGAAASFSWVEPFRPYLIGLTILVLGFAWYQKLKPKSDVDCECDPPEKEKFIQSKLFLGLVSVFAIVMLAFPHYSEVFYPSTKKNVVILSESDLKTAQFEIVGMTCGGCEAHVNQEVNKLSGIVSSKASFEKGSAIVQYDGTKTNDAEIIEAIKLTGYEVTILKEN